MLNVILKGLWAHKRRLAGTFLAVFLGVAFLSGTLVLGDTIRANFNTLFASVTGDTDVVVRNATRVSDSPEAPRGSIDQSLVARVGAVDGVAEAVPVVDGFGRVVGKDGKVGSSLAPPIARNWVGDPSLTPWRLAEGRAPRTPDEVVVNRGAAKDAGIAVGDTARVQTPELVPVKVVGIATFGTADSFGDSSFVAFTLEGAQRHLSGQPGKVTGILLKAAPGVSEGELVERVRAALPGGVEAITGSQLTDEAISGINREFLDFFRTFLMVFAGIALFVAMFSIANTFSILVAQRTRESALLRALGASRRQIVASVALEGLAVGVLASAAGLGGGVGIATALKGVFASFGFPLPTTGVIFKPTTVAIAVPVGVAVTVLAGLLPALRASRVAPLAVLREVSTDRIGASKRRAVTGVALAAMGAATVVAAVLRGGDLMPLLVGAGGALTMAGVVVLGPVVARPLSAAIGAPLPRLRGVTGTLARQNAMRSPRRTAGTATALLVGVGVVTLFTVFTASLRATIDQSVSSSFGGDLVVSSGFGGGGFSPRLAGEVARLPEVGGVAAIGSGQALVGGGSQQVSAADPAALAGLLDLGAQQGSVASLSDRQLAVSRDVAGDRGWRLGSDVPVRFADGATAEFSVGAIYQSDDVIGGYLLPAAAWAPHQPQRRDVTVLVGLRDGADLAATKAAIERVAPGYGGPEVQDREEYAEAAAGGVNMLLTLVYVMLTLAIVIALMGIANTLSLSVHERTRELGLLRAVGETRRQVRAMVRWESVIIALFGTVVGLGLGVFLGWAMVRATSGEDASAFAAPPAQLAMVLAVGAVAGVVAALRPARRAARLNLLRAIAAE